MKIWLVKGSLVSCFFSFSALATETIPICDPQFIGESDLQPYKFKTYAVEGSESTGLAAEPLFFSMRSGNEHRDRFKHLFFEERERFLRNIPLNGRYQLLEYNYCRKSQVDTRCIRFCTVALTVNSGDHD